MGVFTIIGTSFVPHSRIAVPCHDFKLKKGSSWLLSLPYLSLQFSEIAAPMMGSVIKVNQMMKRQQMIQ